MVKHILTSALLIPTILFSQTNKKERVIDKGLMRAQAIISFGNLIDLNQSSMFIHGNLEYHVSKIVTARSDVYYYLQSDDENSLKMNHQLFEGASLHIKTKSNFDPYIGFQPGISLSESKIPVISDQEVVEGFSSTAINPLISGVVGFNFYASKFFHLFIDARYIYGSHLSDSPPISLNEVRISFGLGINVNILSSKKS